jgi:hypothetical protein
MTGRFGVLPMETAGDAGLRQSGKAAEAGGEAPLFRLLTVVTKIHAD